MINRLPGSVFLESSRLFTEFKGAMSENFVLNELIASGSDLPYYWTSEIPRITAKLPDNK